MPGRAKWRTSLRRHHLRVRNLHGSKQCGWESLAVAARFLARPIVYKACRVPAALQPPQRVCPRPLHLQRQVGIELPFLNGILLNIYKHVFFALKHIL